MCLTKEANLEPANNLASPRAATARLSDKPQSTPDAEARRFRALFDGIDDSVFVHDLTGRILDANPAASRRLGYTHEEFLRLNTSEIDAPEFAEGYRDRLSHQIQCGHLHCEGRHRTKDGRIIPVDINTSAIRLGDEQVVLAVIRDVSERKALEEARAAIAEAQAEHAREIERKNQELSQSEARYRMLTEASLDAVIVADSDARILHFNPAAERAFGYTIDEAMRLTIADLMPDHLPGDPLVDLTNAIRRRDSKVVGHVLSLKGRKKGGERFPLEIAISAVETDQGLQFLGSIRDLTDRSKMEAVLAQSERLAAIGQLSAGVAHEINNPLAFVGNNLAVLDRDFRGVQALIEAYEAGDATLDREAPEVMANVRAVREDLDWDYVRKNLGRMLERTREGVGRVASIVHTMRGAARTSPPVMQPASIAELISAALELIQGRVRREGIELRRIEPAEPAPAIRCVPTQISQVLINLLVNAVQAVEESSKTGERAITIAHRREPGVQVIEITDTGDGIDEAIVEKLFNPFFTTKPVGEGTGLGLSITHGIIAAHGGTIEVEGRAGEGATFRVRLPEKL